MEPGVADDVEVWTDADEMEEVDEVEQNPAVDPAGRMVQGFLVIGSCCIVWYQSGSRVTSSRGGIPIFASRWALCHASKQTASGVVVMWRQNGESEMVYVPRFTRVVQ